MLFGEGIWRKILSVIEKYSKQLPYKPLITVEAHRVHIKYPIAE
jgi:hypothetical protein